MFSLASNRDGKEFPARSLIQNADLHAPASLRQRFEARHRYNFQWNGFGAHAPYLRVDGEARDWHEGGISTISLPLVPATIARIANSPERMAIIAALFEGASVGGGLAASP
uniref:Uncharacterized protein n=1 Tax=Candidatus Kentrum sp. TC TaxID=2126339 RepID=A0A450Y963_9GAMM|nr:MAG: hypothetical protein BECKTC1821D_GA0114238_100328 [Candidatus Kentron sp. TC]